MKKIALVSCGFSKTSAFLIFISIFFLTALNAIYNNLAFAVGYEYPYTSFLFSPNDRFADYFKAIFSYPGAVNLHIKETSTLLSHYLHNNPYQGVSGLAAGGLTHFHMPPLTTIISLLNLKVMQYFDPIKLFVAVFLFGFALAYKLINGIAASKLDIVFLLLSLLLCYPTLFMITRGHIFSGISSLSILGFLIFMYRERRRYFALFLLAVAVNLRPNAVVFLFALGLCTPRYLRRDILIFFGMAVLIFLVSLLFSNLIYADYTINNFLLALRIYHTQYVVGDGGLAFGSSLFGALKLVFGYRRIFEIAPVILATLLVIIGTICLKTNGISKISFIFILCASYVLGSSVIADYHLTVFFAPLWCLYFEGSRGSLSVESSIFSKQHLIVFFSSILLLCPKSYLYIGSISEQVVLNPGVLLVSSLMLVLSSLVKLRPRRLVG